MPFAVRRGDLWRRARLFLGGPPEGEEGPGSRAGVMGFSREKIKKAPLKEPLEKYFIYLLTKTLNSVIMK